MSKWEFNFLRAEMTVCGSPGDGTQADFLMELHGRDLLKDDRALEYYNTGWVYYRQESNYS